MGEIVSLAASGPWHVPDVIHDVGTNSYGEIGTAKDGRFAASYYLAALVSGLKQAGNIRYSPSAAVAGVGLPNRPFRVEIPPLSSGHYVIQFTYTIDMASGRERGKSFNLCANLRIGPSTVAWPFGQSAGSGRGSVSVDDQASDRGIPG
jgi:hypothetical protein